MHIRKSIKEDLEAILKLHKEAFGEAEGKEIARLVHELLENETAKPLLSLVAVENDKVVGNVIFSAVKLSDNKDIKVNILAPLAVHSRLQRKGIGTDLINHGLAELNKQGVDIILVLGDPNYYSRVGFKAEHNIKPPYKLEYPEAWMALELNSGTLSRATGVAQCATSLSSPEYW